MHFKDSIKDSKEESDDLGEVSLDIEQGQGNALHLI